ncbi:uncharacterized protein L203_100297 [Cryptococcus depauperatus CBS 7841]|uniref:Uncharacterized protein n=1 Tax=Cryptococcus depauperatus CBS 7841 TaxID=1295531 RepID=A0A1E3IZ29_9TREE|nr:hypothetical protein L203_00044 [Cryptococcus depauperatus CBS 7841]
MPIAPRFFFAPDPTPSPTGISHDPALTLYASGSSPDDLSQRHRDESHKSGSRIMSCLRLSRSLELHSLERQMQYSSISTPEAGLSPSYLSPDLYGFHSGPTRPLTLMQDDIIYTLEELQRVLYLGKEDDAERWRQRVDEMKTVVAKLIENDCVYETPLVTISSKNKLISHFAFLHLFSTGYLPSLTPTSILHHARNITPFLFLQSTETEQRERDKHPTIEGKDGNKTMDHGVEEAWLGIDIASPYQTSERWWRFWEIKSDCREIGKMQQLDGYHLAMIDQVITLRFLPSLFDSAFPSCPPTSSFPSPMLHFSQIAPLASTPSSLPPIHGVSFAQRLVGALASEFEGILTWDLRVRTLVEINEVGKATRIRDTIDLRDAVEALVPFAKRLGWLGRCVGGLISGAVGELLVGLTDPSTTSTSNTKATEVEEPQSFKRECQSSKPTGLAAEKHVMSPYSLYVNPSEQQEFKVPKSPGRHNFLGLTNIPQPTMANTSTEYPTTFGDDGSFVF